MSRRKASRNKTIKPLIGRKKYTTDDVIRASWDSIRNLSDDELYKFAKRASELATNRRSRSLKSLISQDLPIPPSYRNWVINDIPDTFSEKNVGISGLSDYLGKDYDKGFATIDMRVSKDMTRNELIHKIRVAGDFLDNETSTLGGWKKELKAVTDRISKKTGIKLSKDTYSDFWKTYNKVISKGRGAESLLYGTSTEIQQMIYQMGTEFGSFNSEQLLKMLEQRQDENYEEYMENEIEEYDENPFEF